MNIGPIVIICGDEAIAKVIAEALKPIHEQLHQLLKGQAKIMTELETLKAKVAESVTVQKSAVILLDGIKAKLDAAIASGDPAALAQLSADLGTETADLAAAVSRNTPADGGGGGDVP